MHSSSPVVRRLLLGVLVFLVLASEAVAERPKPAVHGVFDGDSMYTLLPPDGIPAIIDPAFLTGDPASAQMSSDEMVMGLTAGDDAVCYSTWQLDHHEIVNDVFAGRPIATCW